MIDDFFNSDNEEDFEDLSHLIPKCEEAMAKGEMDTLRFTEEEFDFLINHYLNEGDDWMVSEVARMGYEQHPYSVDLGTKYADVLIVNREIDRAKEILASLVERVPRNGDIFFLIARTFIKSEGHEAAREAIQKAASLSPEDASDMYHTAAQDYIDSAEYEIALEYLFEARRYSDEDPELLNDIAFCYERNGKFAESLDYYEQFLDEDPFNDNVWFNVGTIHARELRFDKSIEAFDYAIALNPANSSVLYNKAIVYVNTENYKRGIETFEEFLKHEPGNLFAILGIADAFLAMDNFKEAQRYYNDALALDKYCNEANLGMAYILMLQLDHFGSLVYLRRIVGNEGIEFSVIAHQLLLTFKRTNLPEFLLYHTIAQYYLHNREQFLKNMELLAAIDNLWVRKIYDLIPNLKSDTLYTSLMRKYQIK
jgi:tetratricopeptide (TPR) repeat protein